MELFKRDEAQQLSLEENRRLEAREYLQNSRDQLKFTGYLIHFIDQYKNKNFPFTDEELRALKYDALFELAIAVVNSKLHVVAHRGKGPGGGGGKVSMDYNDMSDAKTCIVRRHGKNNTITGAWISGLVDKDLLRALVFCRETNKFYTFVLPRCSYDYLKLTGKSSGIEIPFTQSGEPKIGGKNKNGEDWWSYRTSTFEAMCYASPSDYPESANSVNRRCEP